MCPPLSLWHLIFRGRDNPGKRSAFAIDQAPEAAAALEIYYRATTDAAPRPAPEEVGADRTGDFSATLTWTDPADIPAIAYRVFLDGVQLEDLPINSRLSLRDLDPTQSYTVVVQSIGPGYTVSPESEEYSFRLVDLSTSVAVPLSEVIDVYPNPAVEYIKIRGCRAGTAKLEFGGCCRSGASTVGKCTDPG